MSVISKLETLAWFAVRPSFWSHAASLIVRKFRADHDSVRLRNAARSWASERASSEEAAYVTLGLQMPSENDKSAIDLFQQEGRERAKLSEVQMGGPGAVEFLYGCATAIRAQRIVETGVAYGWSSLAFLAALDKVKEGKLVSVDMPYVKQGNEPWVGVVVPESLRGSWKLVRKPDRNGLIEALADFGGNRIDIAHYDSDKSYWGRRWSYPLILVGLRPGGLFISDDIQDNFYFRDFSKEVGVEPVVIEYLGKYVGCLRKPA